MVLAATGNARVFLRMDALGEDFVEFSMSVVERAPKIGDGEKGSTRPPRSEALSGALKQRGFGFVGSVIVYEWMQACGLVNDLETLCYHRHLS